MANELTFADRVYVRSLGRTGTVTGFPLDPFDHRIFVHLDGNPIPEDDDPEVGTLFERENLGKIGDERWTKR